MYVTEDKTTADLIEKILDGLTENQKKSRNDGKTFCSFVGRFRRGKNEFSNFILTPRLHGNGTVQRSHAALDDEMVYDPKQFGFTRDNAKVQPNYTSRVNPANYPKIYTQEQVADAANRKRELEKFAPPQQNNVRKDVALAMARRSKQR